MMEVWFYLYIALMQMFLPSLHLEREYGAVYKRVTLGKGCDQYLDIQLFEMKCEFWKCTAQIYTLYTNGVFLY